MRARVENMDILVYNLSYMPQEVYISNTSVLVANDGVLNKPVHIKTESNLN